MCVIIYMEIQCPKCKNTLWSDNTQEIEEWIYLMEHDKMKCNICGTSFRLKRMRGTGGKIDGDGTGKKLDDFSISSPSKSVGFCKEMMPPPGPAPPAGGDGCD